MTALIAFLASGLIASIIYYFDQYALYLLVLIVAIVLTKNYFTHKERRTKEIEEEELELIESKSIKGVIFESSKNITKFSKRISKLYKNLLTGISSKNILLLKDSESIVNKLDKDVDLIANNVFYFIKNLDEATSQSASNFHMSVLESLENITRLTQSLLKSSSKHFKNEHRGLTFQQLRELKEIEIDLELFFNKVIETFENKNYKQIQSIFEIKESVSNSLESKIKSQISRTKEKESSPRNTRLYFEILKKTKKITENYIEILELYSDKYDEKISPTQFENQD